MRKYLIPALASAALLAAASAAQAGYWIGPVYYCTWYYNWGVWGCW
jgi:hypothetical protein